MNLTYGVHAIRRRLYVALLAGVAAATSAAAVGAGPATAAASAGSFTLVGSDPLGARGMNAALALDGTVAYVGSRTDAGPGHPHAGVLIVDVADPAHPHVAGEIGPPAEGLAGYSSRELRVWPQQRLLVVMNITCSQQLHACAPGASLHASVDPFFAFFDISDPLHPLLTGTFHTPRTPHEMFLWVDPARTAQRALLFWTSPTAATGPGAVNLTVTDISGWRSQTHPQLATWNGNDLFTAAERHADDVRLHSLSVSADGRRAYLAHLGGGALILDASAVTAGAGAALRLLTPVEQRAHWGSPGAHSAVPLPGRAALLVTDEVYGTAGMVNGGCPWGRARTLDVSDPARPQVLATVGVAEDAPGFCAGLDPTVNALESFSPHNPTPLRDLALVSWHSAGLVVLDLADVSHPTVAAEWRPSPLAQVATEDPVLGGGPDHSQLWSYPIAKDGLVYVVDIRNGLEVLRYSGPHADEVAQTGFREGNSNLGDALADPSVRDAVDPAPAPTPAAAVAPPSATLAAPSGATATAPATLPSQTPGTGVPRATVAAVAAGAAVAIAATLGMVWRRRRRARGAG